MKTSQRLAKLSRGCFSIKNTIITSSAQMIRSLADPSPELWKGQAFVCSFRFLQNAIILKLYLIWQIWMHHFLFSANTSCKALYMWHEEPLHANWFKLWQSVFTFLVLAFLKWHCLKTLNEKCKIPNKWPYGIFSLKFVSQVFRQSCQKYQIYLVEWMSAMWRDMKWRRISEINVPATLSLIYYHFGGKSKVKY